MWKIDFLDPQLLAASARPQARAMRLKWQNLAVCPRKDHTAHKVQKADKY